MPRMSPADEFPLGGVELAGVHFGKEKGIETMWFGFLLW